MKLSRFILGLPLVCLLACAESEVANPEDDGGSDPSTATDDGNGGDASAAPDDDDICEMDCSTVQTDTCFVAVCNEGEYEGPLGQCVVVPGNDGASCDDGRFCTVNDACSAGTCDGEPNTCGNDPNGCNEITCVEQDQRCELAPLPTNSPCTPTDLCQSNGTCQFGSCVGTPKDCSLEVADCNAGVCDPLTGACDAMPDPTQDGDACTNLNDLCSGGNTCSNGVCQGGSPVDCSPFTVGCNFAVCNPISGFCVQEPQPAGTACSVGLAECETGVCDASLNCVPSMAADGTTCNDFDNCTTNDLCTAGSCAGTAVSMCTTYFEENFETCPLTGWTLETPWECGTPAGSGPLSPAQGTGLIGLNLNGPYPSNMTYASNYVETPDFALTSATAPTLVYQHWFDTEGGTSDGYHVQVSTDGGTTWDVLTTMNPPYPLTVNSEGAYGGATAGWEPVSADLSAFAGQTIRLRFAAASNFFLELDGVFIDEVMVLEASAVPVSIDANPGGGRAAVGNPFSLNLAKVGGTTGGWSIQPGGTNDSWLSLDPVTGVLSGTPTAGDAGMVTVNLRYEEPGMPQNFDTATVSLEVVTGLFFDTFESGCSTWTLTGDWACGAPTSGPGSALGGTNVIATNLAGDYAVGVNAGTATATSGTIDLTAATAPLLSFSVWQQWEGSTSDGFYVEVSTDGGTTFTLLTAVTPAYNLSLSGQPAWGDLTLVGWTAYTADLSAFVGQSISLRFQYESDGSDQFPGSYIDDVLVSD